MANMMRRYQRELSVASAYVLLLAVLGLTAPSFFQRDNLRNLLVDRAPVLVAVVGMTLVMLARHIDISIGSQFALCGVVAGLLARANVPMPLVVLGALLGGASLGAVNGILVAGLRLPSIVVTLATMVMGSEALRWWRAGESIRNLPADFQWLGLGQEAGQWLVLGVAAVVFVTFAWALRHLAAGRAVYATGSDPQAAWLVGVRPRRVVFAVFVLMGTLTGLAALLNAVRFPVVDATVVVGWEIQVIAAVVVGGVSVSGGRGTLIGPLIGVALLATIGPGLVFLAAQWQWSTDVANWQQAIQGAVILLAISLDALYRRRRQDGGTRLATP